MPKISLTKFHTHITSANLLKLESSILTRAKRAKPKQRSYRKTKLKTIILLFLFFFEGILVGGILSGGILSWNRKKNTSKDNIHMYDILFLSVVLDIFLIYVSAKFDCVYNFQLDLDPN